MLDKPPSAELRPDQRDDDSLPRYDVLDPLLAGLVEQDESVGRARATGADPEVAERVAQLVDTAEYKRRQSPPGSASRPGLRQGSADADHQPLPRRRRPTSAQGRGPASGGVVWPSEAAVSGQLSASVDALVRTGIPEPITRDVGMGLTLGRLRALCSGRLQVDRGSRLFEVLGILGRRLSRSQKRGFCSTCRAGTTHGTHSYGGTGFLTSSRRRSGSPHRRS